MRLFELARGLKLDYFVLFSSAAAVWGSPELCASCHADEELMAPYDISTDVFETYVDDFHGTTVILQRSRHDLRG